MVEKISDIEHCFLFLNRVISVVINICRVCIWVRFDIIFDKEKEALTLMTLKN